MVFKETGPEPAPVEAKEVPQVSKPSPLDPVELWNTKVDELRAKIKDLQEQEVALPTSIQRGQNRQSRRFMDQTVQGREFFKWG